MIRSSILGLVICCLISGCSSNLINHRINYSSILTIRELKDNTTIFTDENGNANITLKKNLYLKTNIARFGTYEIRLTTGASYAGPDVRGGDRGGPNEIPDFIDDMVEGGATFIWDPK
jgi:hypothetical protein